MAKKKAKKAPPRKWAELSWSPADVQTLFKCTKAEAEDFLFDNENQLRDRLCELGWEVMGTLGDMSGLTRKQDDDEEEDEDDDDTDSGE